MKDFSKYLKDGRRVAAFGQQHDKEVEVFLLYCSKKDHFVKWFANYIYDIFHDKNGLFLDLKIGYHPVVFRIPIKEGDSAQYTFSKYMAENFYRKTYRYYRTTVEKGFLIKDKEMIKVSQKLEKHRWS